LEDATVLTKDGTTGTAGRRTGPFNQAKALGVILSDEFGVPFTFYDASNGELVQGASEVSTDVHACPVDPVMVTELAADGRARVTPVDESHYQLAIVLWDGQRPILVALGRLTALCPGLREQIRLQKWLQATSDRLRLAGQAQASKRSGQEQAALAWEGLLTLDQLLRRTRVHKEPLRNQQRILEAASGLLGIDAIAWVPAQSELPVVALGAPRLSDPDFRQLIAILTQRPDYRQREPLFCNDFATSSGADRFPSIGNVMAFEVTDQGPAGWLLAINKGNRSAPRSERAGEATPASSAGLPTPPQALSSFRRSDAALLTPFVALLELHNRSADRYQSLKELLVGLTRSLTAALDAKDSYTFGHSERVARIAVELGREMGLQGDELSDIYLAGLLHDVGKIGVRDAVLSKVEPLTPEEFDHIKQHVTIGYAILADLRPIRNLLPGVLYHHEHYNGAGYPDGLVGEAIPLLARILAVADAYDAMSTTRPYRDAMPCRKVEEILRNGAGVQWDQRVIEAFQRCRHKIHTIRQRGVGESLRLALDGALRTNRSSVRAAVQDGPQQEPKSPSLPVRESPGEEVR
jgi:HD-GYP domain-containing protein (c-di-GMP phosphodiesterase class II)